MQRTETTGITRESAAPDEHRRPARVLLVEDEPTLAEAFRRVLVSAGFEVAVTGTAMDALLLLQSETLVVDLVLSDVGLPVMSGDELASELRRTHPQLPVLLMTGFSATVSQENAHLFGAAAVLQKPVPLGHLVAAVREAVRTAQGIEEISHLRRPA